MVERLLLLAAATSLVAAETELAMRNTRATPNAPLGLLNLLPLGTQPLARTSCLQPRSCQDDSAFDFRFMEIHHADLPERSAAACSHLCLRQRPGTQVVMAKLISVDERLVCGCGDEAALQSLPEEPYSSAKCSHPCPEGGGLCGGPTAVSVYQLDRNRESCIGPQFAYHGCYLVEVGAEAVTLEPWERWAGGCVARCGSPPSPEARLVKMVSKYDGVTQCECWVSEEQLVSSAIQTGGACGWRCPDGAGWCGDQDQGMVSVYRAAGFSPYTISASHVFRTGFLLHLVVFILPLMWIA